MVSRYCLIVHPTSYRYVSAVADYIYSQLKRHSPVEVDFTLSPDLDSLEDGKHSIVFVIGDPFRSFFRRPGVRYIFFNFSLLYALGPTARSSRAARQWIERKHELFAAKIHLYDYVLDYFPAQAEKLSHEFGTPVDAFPVGLCDDAYSRAFERSYDVCIVGARTPRRIVMERRLSRLGFRLTPATGVRLEDMAARSKVVLNVHAYRTSNIEYARIVSALLSGAILVTEPSPGMADSFPENLYVSASYTNIARSVRSVLDDATLMKKMGSEGAAWTRLFYLPACDALWATVLPRVYSRVGID